MATIEPTGHILGATVRGVDLAKPLDDADFTTILHALGRHGVLHFLEQHLDAAALRDFSRRFGSIQDMLTGFHEPGMPEVGILSNVLENGRPIGLADAGQDWHTDMSYNPTIGFLNVLFAVKVPRRNGQVLGNTAFVNTQAAYEDLSAEIKARLANATATHDFNKFWENMRRRPGSTRGPMTEEQLQGAPCRLLHIPVALGAVVATYNLPGHPELRFTPELLADLFLGRITKWNDKRIKEVNGGVDLPALDLTLVHRSDGSGTTYILADYLSKVSGEWRDRMGRGTSLKWPSGVGAKGNEGVIRQVKSPAGSLGYTELTYAVANRLPVALIRNKAGKFVEPNLQSTTAAAAGAFGDIPSDFRASLTDAPGEASYPIVSFTWALVYQEQEGQGTREFSVVGDARRAGVCPGPELCAVATGRRVPS